MITKNYIFICLLYLMGEVTIAQVATNETILSGGVNRDYILYVPTIYNTSTPVPLILNMHGGTGSGTQQMEYGDFKSIADTANFIIVSPTALLDPDPILGFPTNLWALDWTTPEGQADKTFLVELLEKLKSEYNIDLNRIYSTGFSQGGIMSYNFACFNNITFAGVGIVGGYTFPDVHATCSPIRPTAVCIIHGDADPLATYDGSANPFDNGVLHTPVDTIEVLGRF